MKISIIHAFILSFVYFNCCYGDLDLNLDKCSFRCGGNPSYDDDRSDCPQTAYVFPRRSTTDYIRVKSPLVPIDEFSLCTWVKVYGSGPFSGTILSYATTSNFNQFLILFDPIGDRRLVIAGNGEEKRIDNPLRKGIDNYMCFVIGRAEGFAKVYYNGNLSHTASYANRNPIPSGGAFIIGQEQDAYVGGFDANQAIHGKIRNYMIWDRILTSSEISRMYRSKCKCAPGHILALLPSEIQLESGVNALYEDNECS